MSDSKNEKTAGNEDDPGAIDEELLSLSGPPPSLRFALFVVGILGLTVFMMVWFFPELRFFLRAVRGPTDLGEAADLDTRELSPADYVSVDGLPLMPHALAFNEKLKWFSSNTERHFFPLAGQPHLYVQWEKPDEYRAYRNPAVNPVSPGPPSHFEGHLLRRESMGPDFDKLWVFFDCLKLHSLRRCNYCLGRDSLDNCRDTFTCVEHNTEEECGRILSRSEPNLRAEIEDLEQRIARGENVREDERKLAELKALGSALREHRVAVQSMRLEELAKRVGTLKLKAPLLGDDGEQTLKKLRADILALGVAELETLANAPIEKVAELGETGRKQLETAYEELETLRKDKIERTEEQRVLRGFANTGQELERLKKRATRLQAKVATPETQENSKLAGWKIDPRTEDGKALLEAVDRLEVMLFADNRVASSEHPDAGAEGAENNVTSDAGVVEIAKTPRVREAKPAPIEPKTIEDSLARGVVENLEVVKKRAAALQQKIAALAPGHNEQFDKWVRKPDVLGGVPEGLRAENVIGSIGKLEQILSSVRVTAEAGMTLSKRLEDGLDRLAEIKKRIQALEARAGMKELGIVIPIESLRKKISANLALEKPGEVVRETRTVMQSLMDEGFYIAQLRAAPTELALLEKTLSDSTLEALEQRLFTLSAPIDTSDWVLIDGEIPLDKLWILVIYGLLGVMVVVNIRKLRRFWVAWRD